MPTLRMRITLVAAAVAGLVLAGIALALPPLVEQVLIDRLAAATSETANDLLAADDLNRELPLHPSGRLAQRVSPEGDIVAATPGAVRLSDGDIELLTRPAGPPWVTADDDFTALGPDWHVATVTAASGEAARVAVPHVEIDATVETAAVLGLVSVPPLVLGIGFLVWLAAGAMLRPIDRVRCQATALAAQPVPAPLELPNIGREVDQLVEAFNEVLGRAAADTLRQQRLVADASHELLNPLAAIRSQLDVALRRDGPDWPSVARRCLGVEGRLSEVAQDLLLLARSPHARRAPMREVDLAALVADEAGDFAGVVVDVEQGLEVLAQPQDLARVVRNLLANAVRHAACTTHVSVTHAGDAALLLVDDDGPGVPHEYREAVFEPFMRMDEGRARDHGGAGLGLAIVAQIVSEHGGCVRVRNSPVGGARFEVRLPLTSKAEG